jgi:methyltransferase (TIGR00027 family)
MNAKISSKNLTGIPVTALFPLYGRAKETSEKNHLFEDPYAIKIMEQIDYDFSIYENMSATRKKEMLTGIAVRTRILDDHTNEFLRKYPDGLVVNIGCGLDTRFFRLDNGKMNWIEVNLSEMIKLREKLFEKTERYKMLAASVLEQNWLNEITVEEGKMVMIIAEGTLMYFEEKEVKALFNQLIAKFPKAILCFEVMGSKLQGKVHPSVAVLGIDVKCPWGIEDIESLEAWNPKLKLVKTTSLIDQYRERWPFINRAVTSIFPAIKRKLVHTIVQMEITE